MRSNPPKAPRWSHSILSLTGVQRTVLFVAWLGWMFDIMDTALFNFAKAPMVTEMLGSAQYRLKGAQVEGAIQTWFLIGWAIGGLVFGVLADRWGRARTMIVTIAMYSLLTGITALCKTPEQAMAARFLTGLGIGGEWAAGAALVAETFPDALRGLGAALLQTAAAFGPVIAALSNLALAGTSWRALFLVGVFPAFVCVLIRIRVSDPPRPVILPRIGGAFSGVAELFGDARWRRNVIVAMVLGVVGVTGAGIAPFWIPNLVQEASAGLSDLVVRQRTSNATMILHIGTLLGVFAFPWLAERIGRKKTFALFFACSPVFTFLALYGGADYTRLLVLTPLVAFFAIGLSSGFVLYFPELFPTRLRATGSGLAYNVGRIFSAPMPWLIGITMAAMNHNAAAGVLIASCIYLVGLAVLPFAPETMGVPLSDD